jgi:hypothetical protein
MKVHTLVDNDNNDNNSLRQSGRLSVKRRGYRYLVEYSSLAALNLDAKRFSAQLEEISSLLPFLAGEVVDLRLLFSKQREQVSLSHDQEKLNTYSICLPLGFACHRQFKRIPKSSTTIVPLS